MCKLRENIILSPHKFSGNHCLHPYYKSTIFTRHYSFQIRLYDIKIYQQEDLGTLQISIIIGVDLELILFNSKSLTSGMIHEACEKKLHLF